MNRELEAIVAISKGGERLNEPLGERGRESKKEGGEQEGGTGREKRSFILALETANLFVSDNDCISRPLCMYPQMPKEMFIYMEESGREGGREGGR